MGRAPGHIYILHLSHDIQSMSLTALDQQHAHPDSKIHGANMGPIWGWQDPGGPHVGPIKFASKAELITKLEMFCL